MMYLRFFSYTIRKSPVLQQIQKICLNFLLGEIPVIFQLPFGHHANWTTGAVFKNGNRLRETRWERIFPVLFCADVFPNHRCEWNNTAKVVLSLPEENSSFAANFKNGYAYHKRTNCFGHIGLGSFRIHRWPYLVWYFYHLAGSSGSAFCIQKHSYAHGFCAAACSKNRKS